MIRRLGSGPRADVFLGHSASGENDDASVALKVARRRGGDAVELELLARVEHPHVVKLLDAGTTASGGLCLVLERLERGSLARLLEQRAELGAGEAVTILAPIAEAVDAVHAAGGVHGAISARTVLFRASGAPVLACFGSGSLAPPGRPPALVTLDAGVASDRADLAALAAIVLGRVADDPLTPVRDWLSGGAVDTDGFGCELARRLFAVGMADAVSFAPPVQPAGIPARVSRPRSDESRRPDATQRLAAVRRAVGALVIALRSVRTPVWVLGGSVVVALIAALALVPGSTSAGTPAVASAPPEPEPTTPAAAAAEEAADPVLGDDPLAALGALLEARERCVANLSALCLDDVDQAGSAALEEDVAYVRGLAAGGQTDAPSRAVAGSQLVERLGDTALIEFAPVSGEERAASVLLMRTEAGWRIRDWFDDSDGSP